MHLSKKANDFGIYYLITDKNQDHLEEMREMLQGRILEDDDNTYPDRDTELKECEKNLTEFESTIKKLWVVIDFDKKFHHLNDTDEGTDPDQTIIVQKISPPFFNNLQKLGPDDSFLDFHLCNSQSCICT